MKRVTLTSFLTDAQIENALRLWHRPHMARLFHSDCRREIIEPNLAEINRKLGQENDPEYLAYVIEFVFHHLRR